MCDKYPKSLNTDLGQESPLYREYVIARGEPGSFSERQVSQDVQKNTKGQSKYMKRQFFKGHLFIFTNEMFPTIFSSNLTQTIESN